MVYLISQRCGNENIGYSICRRACRFSHCPSRAKLHRYGSGQTCRRNSNGDGQSGRRSSIWQRQHFLKHGWQIPESSLYSLYPFCERRAVFSTPAIRRTNGRCVGKNYLVSGQTGNHRQLAFADQHKINGWGRQWAAHETVRFYFPSNVSHLISRMRRGWPAKFPHVTVFGLLP